MRGSRLVFTALSVAAAVAMAGCAGGVLPVVDADDASTSDVVLAIRLSPQLSGINAGATGGYVLLVDSEGQAEALEVGPMDVAKMVWADDGLFLGGPTDELLLTDERLKAWPRGSEEAYEWSRFPAPGGRGFISVYNVGFGEEHYLARVTTGDASGVTSWDATGMFRSVSQCDDVVVGITDIAETNATIDVTSPRADVLVQLYPEPADENAAVLATLPIMDGLLESGATDAPCVDGTTYTLTSEYEDPDGGPQRPVLRTWNVDSGHHAVLPLVTPTGAAMTLGLDDIAVNPGIIVDKTYYWVVPSGDVLATDIETGETIEAFHIPLVSPEMGASQFVFTDHAVFVLEVTQDLDAPLDFSRYDLTTGERTRLLSIPHTGSVHDGLNMVIRGIALDPDWMAAVG